MGKVSASIYATPGSGSGGSGGDNGGSGYGSGDSGSCPFCGSGDSGGNGSGTSTSSPAKSAGSKTFSLLAGLNGGQMMALVFVVQGVSTAAVAATAGYTDSRAKAEKLAIEEETK
jgi:hypothetical protein